MYMYKPLEFKDYSKTSKGALAQMIENPFKNSGNMSDRVAATVQGLETWAGVYSEVLQSINFTNTPILKMKVYQVLKLQMML